MYACISHSLSILFFFNDTATTEIYTLSLHDALPISASARDPTTRRASACTPPFQTRARIDLDLPRSEEHTSELQSHVNLVCRLLLEKKKIKSSIIICYLRYSIVLSLRPSYASTIRNT